MWLDFANSTFHPGMDRSSRLAQMELYEVEASCKHADAVLAQRRQRQAAKEGRDSTVML
jgi:hypothetical protein